MKAGQTFTIEPMINAGIWYIYSAMYFCLVIYLCMLDYVYSFIFG